jgi:hypothetical protein
VLLVHKQTLDLVRFFSPLDQFTIISYIPRHVRIFSVSFINSSLFVCLFTGLFIGLFIGFRVTYLGESQVRTGLFCRIVLRFNAVLDRAKALYTLCLLLLLYGFVVSTPHVSSDNATADIDWNLHDLEHVLAGLFEWSGTASTSRLRVEIFHSNRHFLVSIHAQLARARLTRAGKRAGKCL